MSFIQLLSLIKKKKNTVNLKKKNNTVFYKLYVQSFYNIYFFYLNDRLYIKIVISIKIEKKKISLIIHYI
jgi:hypothetical protein